MSALVLLQHYCWAICPTSIPCGLPFFPLKTKNIRLSLIVFAKKCWCWVQNFRGQVTMNCSIFQKFYLYESNLAMPPLVSLWNDDSEKWAMMCHFSDLVVLLIVHALSEIYFNLSKELPRSGKWHIVCMELLHSFLRRHFAGKPGINKTFTSVI